MSSSPDFSPAGDARRSLNADADGKDEGTPPSGGRAVGSEARKRSNQFAAMRRIKLNLPSVANVQAGLQSVKVNIGEGIASVGESARDGAKFAARKLQSLKDERARRRLQRTTSGSALTTTTEILPSMIAMWTKNLDELPVSKDLPRLCRRVTIRPVQGPLLYEPPSSSPSSQDADAGGNKRAVELTRDIILAIVAVLDSQPRSDELAPLLSAICEEASETVESDTLVRRMLELVGADTASVRLLKTIHQDIVGHCTFQLKQHITSRFMTKDVRTPEGWRIGISFLGDAVQVSHTRREQSVDVGGSKTNHWEFEWELRLDFDAGVTEMRNAELRVTDLFLSQTMDPQLEADLKHDLLGEGEPST